MWSSFMKKLSPLKFGRFCYVYEEGDGMYLEDFVMFIRKGMAWRFCYVYEAGDGMY